MFCINQLNPARFRPEREDQTGYGGDLFHCFEGNTIYIYMYEISKKKKPLNGFGVNKTVVYFEFYHKKSRSD